MSDFQSRERQILKYLLKNGRVSTTELSKHLNLSNKTVAKSIQALRPVVAEYGVEIISKPRVGIYLSGALTNISLLLTEKRQELPTTREERVIYICIRLLQSEEYITMQQLADELFVSKGSLENNFLQVDQVFAKQGVVVEKIPGRGIRLVLDELARRQLTAKIVQFFWSDNWYVREEGEELRHHFGEISEDLTGLFSNKHLERLISCLNEFSRERNFHFTDYGFQSLIIHLAIAIERIQTGELLADDSHKVVLFSDETENTTYLIEKLEASLQLKFPEFEKDYINLHLVAESRHAAHQGTASQIVNPEMMKSLKSMLAPHDYDEELLRGLVTHLNSAIKRIKYGLTIKNPYMETFKKSFPVAFEEAVSLKKKLEHNYSITIDDDETTYIAIHLQTYYERNEIISGFKKSAVLVCSSGKGTSQLLAARIRKHFPQLKVTRVLSVQELLESVIDEDIVLSTIYLELEGMPVVKVSPLLNPQDIKNIERNLKKVRQPKISNPSVFTQLFQIENVFINVELTDYHEVITFIGEHLVRFGQADRGIIKSALEREELSYTSFQSYATPHGNPEYIKQSLIVFLALEEPINWGGEMVDKIFFMALKDETPEEMGLIYERLLDIMEKPQALNDVIATKSTKKLYNYFVKGETL